MNVITLAKRFSHCESGAVTVDWVVLTAAVVGLGVAVLTSVSGGVMANANNTEKSLKNIARHLDHGHETLKF